MSNREQHLRKVQALDFARLEAQLFLDTHPECRAAFDYYVKMNEECENVMAEYQAMHGPLFATSVTGDKWAWVEGPWPWQVENGSAKGKKEG